MRADVRAGAITLGPGVTEGAPPIAPADRIPASQKAGYAAGSGAEVFGFQAITDKLWLPFFNIGLGLSPALLGVLLMGFRLIEAFGSPLVGVLSDNTRTRWGRRRPWILVGAALMAVLNPLLFLPNASWTEAETLTCTVIVGSLLFAAYVVWSVPYYSLGLEMTPSYDERTRLGAWTAFAVKACTIPAGWILLFVSGPMFISAATGEPDIVAGVQTYSLLIAPLLFILAASPALFVRERYYEAEAAAQPKDRFWASLTESARCIPLWTLALVSALLVIGFSGFRPLGVYLNIYYVFGGDVAAATALEGVKYTVTFGVGLAALPLLTRLSERFDKRTVVIALLALAAVGQLSNLFLMRPDAPYLQIIPAIFSAGMASSIWMFVPAMKADVADYDELGSGRRREGSLNAFYSWFFKLSLVVSAGLGGFVLQATGFDVKLPAQEPDVLRRMLLIYALTPPALWGACIVGFLFYRLDRDRLADIRRQLEARRGRV